MSKIVYGVTGLMLALICGPALTIEDPNPMVAFFTVVGVIAVSVGVFGLVVYIRGDY